MSYVNAPATRMLATNCCCCGRPLVDSVSVELGMGPICREEETGGITGDTQVKCNQLTHAAAIAAQAGQVVKVREIAEQIAALGLTTLASKITTRFHNAERNVKVTITERNGFLSIKTPFKRSASQDFIAAWRAIPGRTYSNGLNHVPVTSKPQLWTLLRTYFPGLYGKGPQGVFRIPELEAVEAAA